MSRGHARSAVIALSVALACSYFGPRAVRAASVWTYPGNCGAATTLQQCIDLAVGGDTIELRTGDYSGEELYIAHGLTLRPKAGAHVTIGRITVEATAGTIAVIVRDLAMKGRIDASYSGGSGHQLTIQRVRLDPPAGGSSPVIGFDTTVPATLVVTGSTLHIVNETGDGMELYANHTSGSVFFRLVGNRISGNGSPRPGTGIALFTSQPGMTTADIDNNRIWSTGSGIQVGASAGASADFNVVGNTVDSVGVMGLDGDANLTAPAHMRLDAFDNILSHTGGPAIHLGPDDPSTLTFRAGSNDFFANGAPSNVAPYSLGSGNLHVSPKYINAATGDLRLKSTSPVIDKGLVCSPGGVANPDAAGHARLKGSSTDIGAYELGSGVPTGVIRLGTSANDLLVGSGGDDIICGYGGGDTVNAKAGNDYVDGGAGNDRLSGGAGADRLFGGPGSDTLCARDGVHGNDRLDGGSASDFYQADTGDVRVSVENPTSCHASEATR